MVYYSSSLGKIRFNRNILYCKLLYSSKAQNKNINLIETFCILNAEYEKSIKGRFEYLIETFCIVNVCFSPNLKGSSKYLIETFCIVN